MTAKSRSKSGMPGRPKLPFVTWALILQGFIIATGYGVIAPVTPQLALSFGVNMLAAAAIVSAFALVRIFAAPLAGFVSGRIGDYLGSVIGLVIVAAGTFGCAFASDYPQLLLFRAGSGIGSVVASIATDSLLARSAPPAARGRVSSLMRAAFMLGAIMGPLLGGVVAVFGLRAPFVFYGVALLAACSVVLVALRGHPLGKPLPRSRSRDDGNSLRLSAAVRMPAYRALLGSNFAVGYVAIGARMSIVPLVVAALWHGDSSMAAWMFAAYAAGSALVIIPAGRLVDSVGRRPLILAGLLLLGVGFGLSLVFPVPWWFALMMALAGVGSSLAGPGNGAVLGDVLDRRQGGQVVATVTMVTDIGVVAGPLLLGWIADFAGFEWGFVSCVVVVLLAGAVWFFTSDTKPHFAALSETESGLAHPSTGTSTDPHTGPVTGPIILPEDD